MNHEKRQSEADDAPVTDKEAEKQRDKVLERMLKTPPDPKKGSSDGAPRKDQA